MLHTPLFAAHLAAGARMVDFSGWEMPINYGSQIDEHLQVRRDAGMFDVSHMTVVDIHGAHCRAYLQRLLANDVARLTEAGKALYSCMLNEHGGVIDDLIAYYLAEDEFRLVVNAATREKDLQWMQVQSRDFKVKITEQAGLAMIAVQGPAARDKTLSSLPAGCAAAASRLQAFFATQCEDLFIARTGYTGEDGFEISLPAGQAENLWNCLLAAGVKPCGLGARDSLRLEAGMNLYGQDMDETVSPLESGAGLDRGDEGRARFHWPQGAGSAASGRDFPPPGRLGAAGPWHTAVWPGGVFPGWGRGHHQWRLFAHFAARHCFCPYPGRQCHRVQRGYTRKAPVSAHCQTALCPQWQGLCRNFVSTVQSG